MEKHWRILTPGRGSRRPCSLVVSQARDGTIPVLEAFITSCASRRVHTCVCLYFERAYLSSLDSSTCDLLTALAHIVFHSLCAKSGARRNNPSCLKIGLNNFSLTNQGVWLSYVRLRTILSTKNVKKRAGPEHASRLIMAAAIFSGRISLIKIKDLP